MTERHADPGQDRLESLICALVELKSNITLVEQQHPSLSNDLSSLCDLVISHLTRPEDMPTAETLHCAGADTPFAIPEYTEIEGTCRQEGISILAPPDNRTPKKGNFVLSALDKAGDGMINGLDRMGDGVIFIFEKLLSLGPQKKPEANEDPA